MTQLTDVPQSPPPQPPPPPPATPRPMTALASRRCWTEPTVRLWLLLGGTILGMILIYSADRLWSWTAENKLIQHGELILAKVTEAGGQTIAGQAVRPDSPVTLQFDWHGQTQTVQGFLDDRATADYIIVDKEVPIRVDPNDSTNWTYRSQITGIGETLFVTWILLPIPPVVLGVATLKRNQLRKIWQSSGAVLAVVSQRRQTPIAPKSYALQCSVADRSDKRMFVVYVPAAGGRLNKGDVFWILLARGSSRPAAAMWFG